MTAELLINVTYTETRVAYIEKGVLQEIHIERDIQKGIVGNIYCGRVSKILPGIQAVFVDIGLEKPAFLHASDIIFFSQYMNSTKKTKAIFQDITQLVRHGQDVIVQVVKEPIGTKGARLTTDISLPSRYLVFIPGTANVGVSQRIENSEERKRLKNLAVQYTNDLGGFIVRTAAEDINEEEFAQDAIFLQRLWKKIYERKKSSHKCYLLYGELSLAQRILRDFAAQRLDCIHVDSYIIFELLIDFAKEYIPILVSKLKFYSIKAPIFNLYHIEDQINRALERKVRLKSGGYLIIEQTEAMTTIDVNTGACIGKFNPEETILSINVEATQAIAHQLRLRNLGGIIIIDFIDMNSDQHRKEVLMMLEKALKTDRVKTKINNFSELGLVEMTRKRTRKSIELVLCTECYICNGRGRIKKIETICYDIIREIMRVCNIYSSNNFLICVSPIVGKTLKEGELLNWSKIELLLKNKVKLYINPGYEQAQFRIVMT